MSEKITIVIPTHNRHALIERALGYYKTFGCPVIVCDSSQSKSNFLLHPKIKVLYTPELSFDRKIAKALEHVDTPFVCLSADDDFLTLTGVKEGIKFLEEKRDYVSVQGHYVMFHWESEQLAIYPNYLSSTGLDIRSADPRQRIQDAMSNYMHQIYAVFRTEVLQKSFSLTPDYNAPPLAEFTIVMGGMIFGKHKILPTLWMARDSNRYTTYNSTNNDQNTLIFDFAKFLHEPNGLQYREIFSNYYAKHLSISHQEGGAAFDSAIDLYLRERTSVRSMKDKNIAMRIFRALYGLVPVSIRGKIRFIKDKYLLRKPYTQIQGFPWSDPVAKADWMHIKRYLLKYGKITAITTDSVSSKG